MGRGFFEASRAGDVGLRRVVIASRVGSRRCLGVVAERGRAQGALLRICGGLGRGALAFVGASPAGDGCSRRGFYRQRRWLTAGDPAEGLGVVARRCRARGALLRICGGLGRGALAFVGASPAGDGCLRRGVYRQQGWFPPGDPAEGLGVVARGCRARGALLRICGGLGRGALAFVGASPAGDGCLRRGVYRQQGWFPPGDPAEGLGVVARRCRARGALLRGGG
jgi:hypothetical protein